MDSYRGSLFVTAHRTAQYQTDHSTIAGLLSCALELFEKSHYTAAKHLFEKISSDQQHASARTIKACHIKLCDIYSNWGNLARQPSQLEHKNKTDETGPDLK